MANCSICNKKIGMLDLSFTRGELNGTICQECHRALLKVESQNSEEVDLNYQEEVIQRISPEMTEKNKKALYELFDKVKSKHEKEQQDRAVSMKRKDNFKSTTGYNFEGYKIVDYLNIVNAEIVLGTGFLSELSGRINDFFGTNSEEFEEKVSQAKRMALDRLCDKTLKRGGNAIIGVDFNIMTLTNNMIVVSANGTAVEIEKNQVISNEQTDMGRES